VKKGFLILLAMLIVGLSGCRNRTSTATHRTSVSAVNRVSKKKHVKTKFGRVLVVYYSRTKHTKQVAAAIHRQVGGEIVAVQLKKPYATSYSKATARIQQERDNHQLPALKTTMPDWRQYDTVFIGSPIWYDDLSLPIQQLLTQVNIKSGTHVAPFFTSGSSSPQAALTTMKRLQRKADYGRPLGVTNGDQKQRGQLVDHWLKQLKFN